MFNPGITSKLTSCEDNTAHYDGLRFSINTIFNSESRPAVLYHTGAGRLITKLPTDAYWELGIAIDPNPDNAYWMRYNLRDDSNVILKFPFEYIKLTTDISHKINIYRKFKKNDIGNTLHININVHKKINDRYDAYKFVRKTQIVLNLEPLLSQ